MRVKMVPEQPRSGILSSEGGLLHRTGELPGYQGGTAIGFLHHGNGPQGIGHRLHGEVGRCPPVQHRNAGETLGELLGSLGAGYPEAQGTAPCELHHLRHYAVTVVPGAYGGGIPVHGVLHEAAGGALGYAGRRHVGKRREHARAHAAETLLQGLPELRGDTVHLYLGVPVMGYAHRKRLFGRVFHRAEHRVQEGVVVPGQENAVRIVVEEGLIVIERVRLHLEARLHGLQHGVHVHFLLPGIPQHPLVGGEAQG